MADYQVLVARSASREIEALPAAVRNKVIARIELLEHQPRPVGVKKLQGAADLWRLRVGNYRVVYAINDSAKVVDILAVRHRREVYR